MVLGCSLAVWVALGVLVAGTVTGTSFDRSVDRWTALELPKGLLAALLDLSDPTVVVALVVATAAVAAVRRRVGAAVLLAGVPAVAVVLNEEVLKPGFDRTNVIVTHGLGLDVLAYPSGHETAVAAWAAATAVVVLGSPAARSLRVAVVGVLVAYCLAAGMGLVGAFYHFATDIVGAIGWAVTVTVLVGLAIDAVTERLSRRRA